MDTSPSQSSTPSIASATFRYLDLPCELQSEILKHSIPHFSLRIDTLVGENGLISLRVEAAGPEAVKNLIWIPRHLRDDVKPLLLARYDGYVYLSHSALYRYLRDSYILLVPWDRIKVLHVGLRGMGDLFFYLAQIEKRAGLQLGFLKQQNSNVETIKASITNDYMAFPVLSLISELGDAERLKASLDMWICDHVRVNFGWVYEGLRKRNKWVGRPHHDVIIDFDLRNREGHGAHPQYPNLSWRYLAVVGVRGGDEAFLMSSSYTNGVVGDR